MSDSSSPTLRAAMELDTTDVERAEKRVNGVLNRLQTAAGKMNGGKGGGGHGGGGFSNNLMWGFHDMAQGRMTNGLFRLANAFKVVGPAAMGAFAAFKVVSEVNKWTAAQLDETAKASDRLAQSFRGVDRAATFSSSGEGAGALSGKIAGLEEQRRGEQEVQKDLGFAGDNVLVRARDRMRNFWMNQTGALGDVLTGLQGEYKPLARQGTESDLRATEAAAQARKLRGLRSEALDHDAQIAEATAPGGDPLTARKLELDLREQEEITAGKIANFSREDLAHVTRKYNALRHTLVLEKDLRDTKLAGALALTRLQAGNESGATKSVHLARAGYANAKNIAGQYAADDFSPAAMAARNDVTAHAGAVRSAEHALYLNPDGTRRRAGDVQKQLRGEHRAERRMNRWDETHDENGNTITPRARVQGGLRGGPNPDGSTGLTSGAWADTGTRTSDASWAARFRGNADGAFDGNAGESLALRMRGEKEIFEEKFAGAATPGGAAGDEGQKTIDDLYSLMDSRLPKVIAE